MEMTIVVQDNEEFVAGHDRMNRQPDFKEDYLQDMKDYQNDEWKREQVSYFDSLKNATEEELCPAIAMALTKICLKICQSG